jgi:hypothetical protein
MTAKDIPIGGRFTWASQDMIYTVTHQVPGTTPYAHMTYATYGDDFGHGTVVAKHAVAVAGHTEVVAMPNTRASGGTTSP